MGDKETPGVAHIVQATVAAVAEVMSQVVANDAPVNDSTAEEPMPVLASHGFSSGVLITAAIAGLVVLFVAGYVYARRKTAGGRSSAIKQRDLIAMIGPAGAGKTVLLHQIMRGKTPETVMSIKPGQIRGQPARSAGDKSSPLFTLVDVPGHPQLKSTMLETAGRAGGIVVVLDGSAPYDASPANHFRAAADLLYDLFTLPAIVDSPVPVLIALNKADRPGSRSVDAVKALLETELERLKVTRPSVAMGGDDDSDGSAALLLGVAGQHFRFDTDAPCTVSWCSCIAVGPTGGEDGATGRGKRGPKAAAVDDVEAFICDVVAGRV